MEFSSKYSAKWLSVAAKRSKIPKIIPHLHITTFMLVYIDAHTSSFATYLCTFNPNHYIFARNQIVMTSWQGTTPSIPPHTDTEGTCKFHQPVSKDNNMPEFIQHVHGLDWIGLEAIPFPSPFRTERRLSGSGDEPPPS